MFKTEMNVNMFVVCFKDEVQFNIPTIWHVSVQGSHDGSHYASGRLPGLPTSGSVDTCRGVTCSHRQNGAFVKTQEELCYVHKHSCTKPTLSTRKIAPDRPVMLTTGGF